MIDRRGVTSFLAITFGLTYPIEGVLIASGVPVGDNSLGVAYLVIAGVMWVPAFTILGVLGMAGITTAFSVYLNASSLRHRSRSWPAGFTA